MEKSDQGIKTCSVNPIEEKHSVGASHSYFVVEAVHVITDKSLKGSLFFMEICLIYLAVTSTQKVATF